MGEIFKEEVRKALLAFQNLVTLLERQFGIRVCILHTDFGEFNSKAAATYFDESGIIWESSVPNSRECPATEFPDNFVSPMMEQVAKMYWMEHAWMISRNRFGRK